MCSEELGPTSRGLGTKKRHFINKRLGEAGEMGISYVCCDNTVSKAFDLCNYLLVQWDKRRKDKI